MNPDQLPFSLQPVTAQDMPALLHIYRQCEDFLALGPVPTASEGMVQADLLLSQESGGQFFGINLPEAGLVGVVDFIPHGFEGCPEHAFLNLLMIAAPYRSRGLGAQVVQAVRARIQAQGNIQAIYCGVQDTNTAALRFWQRQGFVIYSGPHHFPDGTSGYILRQGVPTP